MTEEREDKKELTLGRYAEAMSIVFFLGAGAGGIMCLVLYGIEWVVKTLFL